MANEQQLSAGRDRIIRIVNKKTDRLCLFAAMLVMALCLSPPGVQAENTPAIVVETLHDELLYVMKNAEMLGYSGRYEKLATIIPASYDFPYIARIVVGKYWSTFNEAEKTKFLVLFTRLSIATYASRFDGYSGESFSVISTKEFRRGRVVVESHLVKPSGEKIEMTYILHKTDTWKIINVVAEGVSDLSLKRADYGAFLKKNSPEALLDRLNIKISKFSE